VSDPRWTVVCQDESAIEIDFQKFCGATVAGVESPIDDYYRYVEHLLTLGTEASLAQSETLGRLLLLGLVTGVEVYLRSILTGVLKICPSCRACAADQMIPFGAVDYYGIDSVEWGLFDSSSLAGAGEIKARTKKLLGLDINPATSLDAALAKFDKICHLRHAAVHARGALGRGNATALGLAPESGFRTLRMGFPTLHQAGGVCHSVVRAYNRFIYRSIVERWIADGRLVGSWESDQALFHPLFALFRSGIDDCGPGNAYHAWQALRPILIRG
jgi:hypothetical protein